MKFEAVKQAEFEAKRFLDRVAALRKSEEKTNYEYFASKASGAVRRASMDLTRALAELRKF